MTRDKRSAFTECGVAVLAGMRGEPAAAVSAACFGFGRSFAHRFPLMCAWRKTPAIPSPASTGQRSCDDDS